MPGSLHKHGRSTRGADLASIRCISPMKMTSHVLLVALLLAKTGASAAAPFYPQKLAEIDLAIALAVGNHQCPGGVIWLEREDAVYRRAYGQQAIEPAEEPMTEDTIFDAASLTKVIATTTAVMQLVEAGKLDLESPASWWMPDFTGAGKEHITIRQLLTHTSGLRAGLPPKPDWTGPDEARRLAIDEPLPDAPGTIHRYSDINFIVLGWLVEVASGRSLAEYCRTEIFEPLQMQATRFCPPAEWARRIAPTSRGTPRGIVHDPTARKLGGIAGNAGLFTSAGDLARFCRMILRGGELDGVRILQAATVQQMTSVQTPEAIPARRGLGWDIDSPYAGPRGAYFPLGSYGHTGWTGGSIWIDPFSGTFVIFLSNRNHPTEAGDVREIRRTLSTLAAESIPDFNFLFVPGALSPR